ncbi:MAG: GntR family transcriptional regulator [Rhodospirillaceae bacterium]
MITTAATPLEFQPDPRSLAEKAYQILVRKIIRLELTPGEPLAEKVLIEELEIGRTPIREALQRLAVEGLVVHVPNRGMFVTEVNATNAQHIYEFRSLIEAQAARLAATRASEKDIRELTGLHLALVEATEGDDIDRYVDCDRQFYSVLARAAQNTYLAEVIPRIFNLHLRLWFMISERVGGWHEIARAHEEMTKDVVDAIARHEPDEAELAIKIYVHRRHQDIRAVL